MLASMPSTLAARPRRRQRSSQQPSRCVGPGAGRRWARAGSGRDLSLWLEQEQLGGRGAPTDPSWRALLGMCQPRRKGAEQRVGPPDPHAPQKGADPPLFPPLPPSPTPPALSSVQAQHPDRPPPSVTALARVRTDVAVIPTSTGNQLVVQRPLALGQRMIALAAAISIDYGARRGAVPCRAAHRRTVRQACSACQPLAVEHLPACSWPSQ